MRLGRRLCPMIEYSVVIPARNEERHITGALESVLAQTLAPRAVIVVDDGSTDRTGELAAACGPLQVVRHEISRGLAAARNSGVAAVATPWVAFLDADDRWDATKIARQAEVAAATGAGLVYCGLRSTRGDGSRDEEVPATVFRTHRLLRRELACRNCITGSGSGVLVRTDLLRAAGGFAESLRVSEDWDMWLRLSVATTFAAVEEPLLTLLQRPASLGSDPERIFRGALEVIGRNSGFYGDFLDGALLRRRARSRAYERLGQGCIALGRMRQARRCYLRAAWLWPFRSRVLHPLIKLCTGRLREARSAG
ncbi:MAG: glycosyltransferase family 2 protein [Planctomycetaceae bacterium]